jgi:DNA-binding response OmpR family regulator
MKRILIVDDDELGARLVRRVLARQEYECKEARRATDGLSMLDSSAPPDLIILDYLLPDMNGPEFYKQARSQGFQGPVLFLTALAVRDAQVEQLKLEVGEEAVLTKPYEPDELERRVEELLERP